MKKLTIISISLVGLALAFTLLSFSFKKENKKKHFTTYCIERGSIKKLYSSESLSAVSSVNPQLIRK
jgi:hypothetical protein